MSGDTLGMNHLQAMELEQLLQALQRVVTKVLVIDGVILQCLNQTQTVMRLRNKYSVLVQKQQNVLHHFVDVLNVSKDIGSGHDLRRAVICPSLESDFTGKKLADRLYSPRPR